jgi:hypothetical protein
MTSLNDKTGPAAINRDGYKPTPTVFAPPAWLAKVSSKSSSATSFDEDDDFYIIESDDDPFANFTAVVFASAEDHDFAYGVTTTSGTTAAPAASAVPVATTPVKMAPVLNLANSRIFRQRAEAKAAKEAAATPGNATPVITSAYKSGTSCLSLIDQFWGMSASSPVKMAPTLNLANSRLFRRRAEVEAAKKAAASAESS